ncbi:hypothetical protein BRAS3843_2080023 [Bradyrhizobium sp. STM 3843]|nr:hypothetical protein BRAS3843_2080023 [Bradyrhizobium sp. STM 3843]
MGLRVPRGSKQSPLRTGSRLTFVQAGPPGNFPRDRLVGKAIVVGSFLGPSPESNDPAVMLACCGLA